MTAAEHLAQRDAVRASHHHDAPGRRYSTAELQDWRNRYQLGATITQIANDSRFSRETVRKALVASGVKLRAVHHPQPSEKRCNGCGEVKPADQFSKKTDGRLRGQCKACITARVSRRAAERRRTDPEFRERGRKRAMTPARIAATAKLDEERKTPGTPAWARRQVHGAVQRGRLVKPENCERCGATPPRHQLHGHHWHGDYANRPLEVMWLCSLCHGREHAKHLVRDTNAEPAPGDGAESNPRVQARRPEEAGSDGSGAAPTACACCGRPFGIYTSDRLINGRPSWEADTCPSCVWDIECDQPTVRMIPGAPRIV